jgi:hypothetical protein
MQNFLNQNRAAAYLGVTVKTIKRYRNKGVFNPLELGTLVLYSIHELQDFRANYVEKRGRAIVTTGSK